MQQSRAFYFLVLMFLCSCGYRFGSGQIGNCYKTICVPYVDGDERGWMTNALVHAFSRTGALAYSSYGSDLILKVCLFEPRDEMIGFIYAPSDEGNSFFSNLVVSNEARLTMTAKMEVIDRKTGVCIIGPLEVTSFIDYDFEPDLSNINEHAFSLGQLEMHNLAQDAAYYPLYSILAEKIVDFANHSW